MSLNLCGFSFSMDFHSYLCRVATFAEPLLTNAFCYFYILSLSHLIRPEINKRKKKKNTNPNTNINNKGNIIWRKKSDIECWSLGMCVECLLKSVLNVERKLLNEIGSFVVGLKEELYTKPINKVSNKSRMFLIVEWKLNESTISKE